MKRKIVQHGSSSLTISLPYKWAKKYNLNKGNEVEVEERGNSLCINSKSDLAPRKITFTISNKNTFLRRYIISLYKQGYDEIEVIAKDGIPIKKINNVLEELLGFEIIEQSANRCLIKNLAQVNEEDFDPVFRRLFLITISFGNEIVDSIKKKDFDILNDLSKIQYTNNKLSNLCQRILNKKGYKDYIKTNYMYSFIDQLEQAGDHNGDLCDYLYKNHLTLKPKIIDLYKEVNMLLEKIYSLFYKFSNDDLYELKEKISSTNEKLVGCFTRDSSEGLLVVSYLLQLLERANHMALFIIDI